MWRNEISKPLKLLAYVCMPLGYYEFVFQNNVGRRGKGIQRISLVEKDTNIFMIH